MYEGSHFQLMAQYNRWMNRKLYAICAEIPDADRKKDLGAFFKSLHGTLNHLLYGDKAWMGRFLNDPFKGGVNGPDLYACRSKTEQRKPVLCRRTPPAGWSWLL